MCSVLNHPGDHGLKLLVTESSLKGCTVTTASIAAADDLFGVCLPSIAGKTTAERQVYTRVPRSVITGERLHADFFFLKSSPYLLCIDEYSGFITITHCITRVTEVTQSALVRVINAYKTFNHKVREVHTDREKIFSAAADHLQSIGTNIFQIQTSTSSPY